VEVQEEKVFDEQKRAKVYRNLRQLENSFNPEAAKIVERIEQGREILFDHANFGFFGVGTVERNLQFLKKLGIMMIQGLKRNGVKPSIKNLKRWRRSRFGKS
jgi:hypothetical protein